MLKPELKKRTLTPEKAVEILAEHGTKVTLEEAEIMLDFIYEFAKLAISLRVKEL
ncbi:MAG: hypothetical protein WC622_14675 [Pedobacter sp.]|jgi:hypothetical protein|uniref:hypothetical protein n=1 Tax=Pedobacter sp. TaxID=1411316 RepID=UPI0035660DB5